MELSVDDLAVARGGVVLLEGVSFRLHAGDALILHGPNGCGKTTLLRTVAGLQPPQSGRITLPPDSAALAGHADGIKPTLTVAENLRFWAAVFGTDAAGRQRPGEAPPLIQRGQEDGGAVSAALGALELSALRDRPAQNLSAGQKRRLGIARLLVSGRPIWILDEPTVSLDAASTALFAKAMRAHLAGGGAALIATHIDIGLPQADTLDLGRFRAVAHAPQADGFDEAFL